MVPMVHLEYVIDAPEHRESLTMIADDRAPRAARSFTREMLTAWGVEDLLDRAVLIVSELTTNAELHGSGLGGHERAVGAEDAERIKLTLAVQANIVGIEVEDNSPLPPIPRPSSPDAVDGRGLLLVTAEADAWTACSNEDGSGKRVRAFVKRPASTA
ncbi:ATP-binding protein [Streptomyces sp. NPDC058256]|uniref:ATP-binding protein n=1 Tax=Streptomyces sp. NPDC058256 TaxID=3346408 RepID=UPI0036EB9792